MKTKNDEALKAFRCIANVLLAYVQAERNEDIDKVKQDIKTVNQALESQVVDVESDYWKVHHVIDNSTATKEDVFNAYKSLSNLRRNSAPPEIAGKTCKENAEILTDDTQRVKETQNSLHDGHDTLTIPMLLKQIEKLKQGVDVGEYEEAYNLLCEFATGGITLTEHDMLTHVETLHKSHTLPETVDLLGLQTEYLKTYKDHKQTFFEYLQGKFAGQTIKIKEKG